MFAEHGLRVGCLSSIGTCDGIQVSSGTPATHLSRGIDTSRGSNFPFDSIPPSHVIFMRTSHLPHNALRSVLCPVSMHTEGMRDRSPHEVLGHVRSDELSGALHEELCDNDSQRGHGE